MYNKLFEKGRIGKLELKNRLVMPAMGVNYSSAEGEATAQEKEISDHLESFLMRYILMIQKYLVRSTILGYRHLLV